MVVGEFTQETDLVVIGGGPAGYTAAFRAAELGVATVIVDSHHSKALGGVCLHDGCVPSKTLLHLVEIINLAESAGQFGLKFGRPSIDLDAVRAWKDKTIKRLAAGLEGLCKKYGVERIQGQAQFEDSRHMALRNASVQRIRFRRALLAPGASPKVHANVPFDGERILTPGEALSINPLPKTLLVCGGDSMAVELASIYAALGSTVTLVNEADRLLPDVDIDLVRPLAKRLEAHLAALHNGTAVAKADVDSHGVRVTFQGAQAPQPAAFESVIVAAGHVGNTRGLQLEKTKAQVNADEFVAVDKHMRTADPRLFAAGDVTGPPLLADKAMHQGRVAAEVIAGKDSVFEPEAVPMTIFTDPQIAWCGIMEHEAGRMAMPFHIARIPWGASGRAVGMGRSDGLTKIVYQPESQLVLGVGMVGPHACELIAEGALALEMGATLTDLAMTMHPHPTMSELLSDAARQMIDRPT